MVATVTDVDETNVAIVVLRTHPETHAPAICIVLPISADVNKADADVNATAPDVIDTFTAEVIRPPGAEH